jgi:hypothetical protein
VTPGLYIRGGDGGLIPLQARVLGETSDLQPLLAREPQLLAGDKGEDTRYLLVQRELGIAPSEDAGARWNVDHLFLDQEGTPTLVEVKHSSNTEIRREIVGQLLEYAANFSNYWTAERIRDSFENRCARCDLDPEAELAKAVAVEDADAFWQNVDEKISARRLRLIFVADDIPSELRQIIEFLNEGFQDTEVLGVEIREHSGENGSLVTAQTIGSTEAAHASKGHGARRKWRHWSEAEYLESVRRERPAEDYAAIVKLVAWAKGHDPELTITFGTGVVNVGMQIGIKRHDAYLFPFTFYNRGGVEVNFQQMANVPYPPFQRLEKRRELQRRLNEALDAQIPDDRTSLRPNFSRTRIQEEGGFARFLDVFEWCLQHALASGIGTANLADARADLESS